MGLIADVLDIDEKTLASIADNIVSKEKAVVVLGNKNGFIICASNREINIDCIKIIREAAKLLGGGGGGKPNLAQGGGPLKHKIKEAVETGKKLLIKEIDNI
ncbi:MAG TPA: hypothetical protein ENG24_00755 [Thermoplasmatales archaeon]|nr:hypothetical protein [Thermoplasmatales archaeon]